MTARRDANSRFIKKDAATGSSVQVVDSIRLVQRASETAAEQAVEIIVRRVSRSAQRLLSTRNWKESGPSKPGQPPSLRTGALAKSVPLAASWESDGDGGAVGIVGSTVKYSVFLELGTSNVQPRPFLRPAIDENADRIERLTGEALAIQLRAATLRRSGP